MLKNQVILVCIISINFQATDDQAALLTETVAKVLESQMDRAFRSIVLDLLLHLFSELEEPDFVSMCQCLIKLEKPDDVADILQRLVSNKVSMKSVYLMNSLCQYAVGIISCLRRDVF